VILVALLVALAAAPPRPPVRPNLELTPGLTRTLSREQVCSIKWGKDRRHVTEGMKKQVFEAYGIPWEQHARFEVDHLVSRELGGADDVRNLWPQLWTGTHNARMKDHLENTLHRKVCAGEMTLRFAQEAIASDWVAAYRLYVGVKTDVTSTK
jgi:hypothetical protein